MDDINLILKKTFDKRIFDKISKKKFKDAAIDQKLSNEDLNFCIKTSFDMVANIKSEERDDFVFDWLRDVVNSVNDLKSDINAVSLVKFSPIDDCSASIIDFIHSAKKSLHICVFTISDDRISEQILLKYREGLEIKIITDDEKQFDKGSDIGELFDAGIDIKIDQSPHHMHHKFAITDNSYLLTGSYNWTRSAAMYNQENFLIIKDEYAVQRYLAEFYRLWKTSVSIKK